MVTTKVETKNIRSEKYFSKIFVMHVYHRTRTVKEKWKKRVLNKQKDTVYKSKSGSYLRVSRFHFSNS